MWGDSFVFCVDNSESAFLNEDYPGSRWGYQRQALTSLCGQYALQSGNSKQAAHTTFRQSRAGMSSMCVVAAGDARLQHPPCPLRGSDAALASLLDLEMAEGPHSQYQKALLLAALVARRHTSAHIIAFVAGPCRLGQNDIPGLISRLQGARLDVIMLASAAEVGSSTVQALQSLVDGLNGGASTAADTLPGTRPACSASQVEVSEASGRHISSTHQSSEAVCDLAMPSEACSRQAACEVDAASEAAWHGPEAAEKLTGRASRLVCVQPPQEGLEVWQHLEPLMELLECSNTAASRRSAPQSPGPAPASAHPNVLTVPSAGSSSDIAPRFATTAAQQGAGLAVNRPATNANAAQLWQQQNQWHCGRALLARRSGLVTPALCRNESLDLLHHLSSDGFSRPWLPNYANLPQRAAATQQQQQQQQQRQPPNCNVHVVRLDVPRYQTLLELPAGRLLAPDSRGSASQQPLQSCEGTLEDARNAGRFAAFSSVPSTFAAHCSRPWGGAGPHTIPVAAPVQSPFDVPVTWKRASASAAAPMTWKGECSSAPTLDDHILRWSAHKSVPETPRSGIQPAAARQRSPQPLLVPKALPGLKGVHRKPVAARCSSPRERAARTRACGRPVRLEADACRGKLSLVLSSDERHKLKLLWTPEPAPQPVSSRPSDTLVSSSSSGGSSSAYTSVWDRPAAPATSAGASRHQVGASTALPPAELAVTLDPAAVSFSSTQGGRVLVVQQRLAVQSKQRPPSEGIIGLTPEGHQVERWFFWMQQAAPAAAAIASPPAGTSTIVQADSASRIAARLQALIANAPRSSARNAFRSPMRSTEGWPHGNISLSLSANIKTEASLNGHPFSFSFQTHQPSVSASSSDSTECPGHILRGSQGENHHSMKRTAMDKTQQREANADVAAHNTEQNSCQSCVDGSNCRECEGSPGSRLQQGLMSGGAALVTTGDACKDAVPEESVLFELD